MTVAVFLLPALIITICQVTLVRLVFTLLITGPRVRHTPALSINDRVCVAWMKCWLRVGGSSLLSEPWDPAVGVVQQTGIFACLLSVLLYLGKDISRVQPFLLIKTALGGLLPRWLPARGASCRGGGMHQISTQLNIDDLFSKLLFQIKKHILALFIREEQRLGETNSTSKTGNGSNLNLVDLDRSISLKALF